MHSVRSFDYVIIHDPAKFIEQNRTNATISRPLAEISFKDMEERNERNKTPGVILVSTD